MANLLPVSVYGFGFACPLPLSAAEQNEINPGRRRKTVWARL